MILQLSEGLAHYFHIKFGLRIFADVFRREVSFHCSQPTSTLKS
jgi:hypothetical protein